MRTYHRVHVQLKKKERQQIAGMLNRGRESARVEPKAGRHFTRATADRSSPEFADYLLEIAEKYPRADTIHLVMDTLSSHTRKAVVERFGEKAGGWLWDRFTVHYTPKHGSGLNQAEIEISLFSRQCLGQRRIPSLGQRRCAIQQTRQRPHRCSIERHHAAPSICLRAGPSYLHGSCRQVHVGDAQSLDFTSASGCVGGDQRSTVRDQPVRVTVRRIPKALFLFGG